jgi:putative ABC transport system permease protein
VNEPSGVARAPKSSGGDAVWLGALQRKLRREIGQLKGQIATIALVIAGGVTCFVSLRGTCDSLEDARVAYYDRYRLADVFAHVERAPESIARRIEALPGVARVQTRITEDVTLPIEGMSRPASGRLLSLPASGEPATNALRVLDGRLPERGRDDEVAILQSFAEAHCLLPGHRIPAVINGKLRELRVVGIVLSPEFVYAIRPGALVNDPQRYAVLWMERSVLASAFQLDGAFNDVTLRLQPGAVEPDVLAGVDRLLQPYGGDGAIGRDKQNSNRMLTAELSQLQAIAGMVPLVFLGVAAFLLNLVLGRLITLQRGEIATLKAVGYTNAEITRHYLALVGVVLVPGALLGVAGGWFLGRWVLAMYAGIFRFPDLSFRMSTSLVASAILVSAVAAVSGALLAVRKAAKLPPAEAMRPPAPERYRRGILGRLGLGAIAGTSGIMVLREIQRRPLRTALSAFGVAGAIALIIFGHFGTDSLDDYLAATFHREQRQDLTVSFLRPVDARVVGELGRMPGVITAEGTHAVAVRARSAQHVRDTALVGLPTASTLRRLVGHRGAEVPIPADGVIVEKTLAEILDVHVGDRIELELREGDRRTVHPVVAGLVDETVGLFVYARSSLIADLEHDAGAVSAALLKIDASAAASIEERLRRSPQVVDVNDLGDDMRRLRDLNGSMMDIWTFVSVTLSACVIFGVIYNDARIALASRSRELATLRVLGLSRGEISSILVGGLAFETALAIPAGLVLGRIWSGFFMSSVDKETFRWSVFVAPQTYVLAAATALLSAAVSALWVRRRLDHLDLVGVLKTRE